jgi:hypothetical protein
MSLDEPIRQPEAAASPPPGEGEELESYAGGEILSRHGPVNRWLLCVYLGLLIWGIYYLFTYWGGLGPGLAY